MTQVQPMDEEESVAMLAGMMGVGKDQARRVLRKFKGDVEKAADAMLAGDQGDDEPPPSLTVWPPSTESSQDPGYIDPFSGGSQTTIQPSSTIIDLTADDSVSTRTVKLDKTQNNVQFGPSERAPDPAWQMVTTNAPIDTTHDDQAMNRAIEASLADLGSSDELEILPMAESVREGGRPIALRTEASEYAYAALPRITNAKFKVIQALFQVPQVRHSVAALYEPARDRPLWCMELIELFANLDLAQLSGIVDKEYLPGLDPPVWNGNNPSPGSASAEFIRAFADRIESQMTAHWPEDEPPRAESRGRSYRVLPHTQQSDSVVDIDVGTSAASNDLISHLSNALSSYDEISRSTTHDVIVDTSELVIFQLIPPQGRSTVQGKTTEPFTFPKQFYLDRFILENLSITEAKKAKEREILEEIAELTKKKELLTRNEGRDVLTDLRASLYYFQEVAERSGSQREISVNRTAEKLKKLLDSVVSSVHVAEIDVAVEKLQSELSSLFDVPELQNHLYDLRAVLMHTGFPGRKHIYSYIQDSHGVWWKTLDHAVTEVPEETVLSDPTGLHLGAGPYLLIYSRHLSDEDMAMPVAWPPSIADTIEESNKNFFALLKRQTKVSPLVTTDSAISMASASTAILSDRGRTQSLEDVDMD
ncbi:hypothetical protein H0H92_007823 [Tricholoma furcatifolium]|nr:hypothetical protein H0H92_007823 [Tricholoma furcatifolium]